MACKTRYEVYGVLSEWVLGEHGVWRGWVTYRLGSSDEVSGQDSAASPSVKSRLRPPLGTRWGHGRSATAAKLAERETEGIAKFTVFACAGVALRVIHTAIPLWVICVTRVTN